MTEEQQLLQIERMCHERAETVVKNLHKICFGPNPPQVNSDGCDLVKLIVMAEFLPLTLHLGTRQNVPAAYLSRDTLDFVRSVLSVPESMVHPRLREMAENLLGRL